MDSPRSVHPDDLRELGWSPADDLRFADTPDGRRPGRVVIMHGRALELAWFPGDGPAVHDTFELGRDLNLRPVAGDWVAVQDGRVVEVGPRRTALQRPDPNGKDTQVLAANIDTIMIVQPIDRPLNLEAIERLQVMAWDSGAAPVLVLTKSDGCPDIGAALDQAGQAAPGVPVLVTSALDRQGLEELRSHLGPGTTTTMLGASGVGKTSLLNALEGRNEQVQQVGAGGAGRHTTTTRRLFRTSAGGVLLDVPGIRSLDLLTTDEGVGETFADITEAARHCRFRDCGHAGDRGCAVEEAVRDGSLPERRLESWRRIQREQAYQDRRNDPAAMAEQRKVWKQMCKEAKRR
ncbi:ribosome small subunit-dependent GTPase A [Actinoplanes sp. SE50]|uniref:ribosome small subunit-dependent GTPase A n=1 Tax=unclassified Actinoplanes TaxID=2626549 RepID=UPI00023ECA07|nr:MULTISPECIES: ribosome small subunit-dependent GTPase A [unclassified Actinoplanes]AEV87086.1 ribosome biogenesis GTPase [Actinoplanes sp. SE50/110]ATO85484.1 ribosome small subunit-dependent GTPase A [Actinoplanes sp. SE50]SLM02896.1 ribosome small subunit-dependent GTPase A [Actinoplanes sp. SE50/110]